MKLNDIVLIDGNKYYVVEIKTDNTYVLRNMENHNELTTNKAYSVIGKMVYAKDIKRGYEIQGRRIIKNKKNKTVLYYYDNTEETYDNYELIEVVSTKNKVVNAYKIIAGDQIVELGICEAVYRDFNNNKNVIIIARRNNDSKKAYVYDEKDLLTIREQP